MDSLSPNIIHYTPPMEHLLPFSQLKCSAIDCASVFTNAGNLEMHLQKHHKIERSVCASDIKLFYCPVVTCVYNVLCEGGKHFKCLKYLRQHFQKVHAVKQHACTACGKQFGTPGLLKSHLLHACGKQFQCMECGWKFEQREALLMHGKRKGHALQRTSSDSAKLPITRQKPKRMHELTNNQHQETQTEVPQKTLKVAVAQTEKIFTLPDSITCAVARTASFTSNTSAAVDFESMLCDIETQTELPGSPASKVTLLDQMLSHSSNMHTQTCDEFLNELGLADIQTQTNWSSLQSEEALSATERSTHAHDELFVSTETQTSFTQCLLEGSSESTFSGLCNTQHTQTCETLLEGLFGAQETDFMGTFHSAYTQT